MRKKRQHSEPMELDGLHDKTIYFHAEYFPWGVKISQIQNIFHNTVAWTRLFTQQIVAFSRPKNLRDLLPPSTLPDVAGQNPSDYLVNHAHKDNEVC